MQYLVQHWREGSKEGVEKYGARVLSMYDLEEWVRIRNERHERNMAGIRDKYYKQYQSELASDTQFNIGLFTGGAEKKLIGYAMAFDNGDQPFIRSDEYELVIYISSDYRKRGLMHLLHASATQYAMNHDASIMAMLIRKDNVASLKSAAGCKYKDVGSMDEPCLKTPDFYRLYAFDLQDFQSQGAGRNNLVSYRF